MPKICVDQICQRLAEIAPLRLAESWDNVGLLVGDRGLGVSRVMTCLTVTPAVVQEAVDEDVDLLIAHHPLPFKPLSRLTTDTIAGAMLLRLVESRVAVYSAHTAFDSAASGINQLWADRLGVVETQALIPPEPSSQDAVDLLGSGRYGKFEQPVALDGLAVSAANVVGATQVRRVGAADQVIRRVAFACGSGGSFLAAAKRNGCDALVTGEATFHTCLEAEALRVGLVLLGHYWSERFAMEWLAQQLSESLAELTIWPSRLESDPIQIVAC
ncbi:Nif3-like dinuclear metal center hexameric protein [Novipirellula caenicola]|uniref:Nif3-like dinuclear metal center hexameric protein n=1 Tax=Novipirellula caenicola TaxID=1536901 RepID=UPI0031ED1C9E